MTEIDWKQKYIWIAIPSYGGTVTCMTMKSILFDIIPLIMAGAKVKIFDEVGHADIYLARAQIIAHFMADEDKPTDLVMVDSDVGWPAGGLHRLLGHRVDCVAGAYPKREYPITFMFRSEQVVEDGMSLDCTPEGLVEVLGMPFGFMRLTRSAIKTMLRKYKHLNHYDKHVPGETTCRLFDPYWWTDHDDKARVLSEDYSFCQRYIDAGGKVWMDPSIPMAHIGNEPFKGCLGQYETDDEEQAA